LWDAATLEHLRDLGGRGATEAWWDLRSADGAELLGTNGEQVVRWEVALEGASSTMRVVEAGTATTVYSMAPIGETVAVGGVGRSVDLWNWRSGTCVQRIGRATTILWLGAKESDRHLFCATEEAISIWDLTSGTVIRTIKTEAPIESAASSPDGHLVATCHSDGAVLLWRHVARDLRLADRVRCDGWPTAIAMSNDTVVVGCVDSTVYVFRFPARQQLD
jgi:WD40 repeat protein